MCQAYLKVIGLFQFQYQGLSRPRCYTYKKRQIMQLYIVYCSNDNYKPPTFHATKEQAMKSYMYLTRLIGDRHAVKVGTLQVTALPEYEVFDYAQTHYIERTHRSNSVDEELQIHEI